MATPLRSSITLLTACRPPLLAALWLAGAAVVCAQTPATSPHWSTFFGRSGHDDGTVVRLGPGGLVTVAGTTTSPNLPTAGFQPVFGGVADAFVARFDPSRPAGQQLVWCTYLGGSGTEVAFDAVVDGNGVTTVVGLTDSPDFPMHMRGQPPTGYQPTKNGTSDGFIAQIDGTGGTLLYATYVGGSANERLCGVAADPSGRLAVVGVTESRDLQGTAGTAFPSYRGGLTDAFVARIDPAASPDQQLVWATYLGATGQDGGSYSTLAGNGGVGVFWLVNLRKQSVAIDPATGVVIATTVVNGSALPDSTTAGCYQPNVNGLSEAYLAFLDPTGATLLYGTHFGGSARDFPYAMALHPAGGVVIAGSTTSTGMPVTQGAFQTTHNTGAGPTGVSDAFVCWLDPSQSSPAAQLRYSTFYGGDGGEDIFTAVAVESSGIVTLAGTGFAGSARPFPTTPGSLLRTAAPFDRCGAVVRLAMNGGGAGDLVYGTLLGRLWTVLHGVALDAAGDVLVTGATDDTSYPTSSPYQATYAGPSDVAITHLPLLPGGTSRRDVDLAAPACADPLYSGTLGAPQVGNAAFGLSATNAPPLSLGMPVFGWNTPPRWSLAVLNASQLVQPPLVIGNVVLANALGFARHPLPLPATAPVGLAIDSQWWFLTNAACPGSGPVATSGRLVLTTF